MSGGRFTSTVTTTVVRHVAKPMGPGRENGPHLGDLREFVRLAEGLPDDVRVFVDEGYLGESGRRDVTLRAEWRHNATEEDQ